MNSSSMAPQIARFISSHRVARLATADAQGRPHVVPVCFAFDGRVIYSALDLKPKQVAGNELKRVRNIRENPRVALVIDDYAEDWNSLVYVLIRGTAAILKEGAERERAESLLRRKYVQYQELLEEGCTVLKITPTRITSWGRL